LSVLAAFVVVVWMTDGWPLYESRLKGKLHVISKRYTQRIERKRLVRTVLIFTESSDQLSRATDRVPGLPASPGYVQ
uniref:IS1 family transposase n=1 Tax=Escherichia coli TaxID=562 RepID=UPI002FBE46EA